MPNPVAFLLQHQTRLKDFLNTAPTLLFTRWADMRKNKNHFTPSGPSATLSPAQSGGEGRERGRAPVQGFNARFRRRILSPRRGRILCRVLCHRQPSVLRAFFPANHQPAATGNSTSASFARVRSLFPLPGGEGQGEGERHTNLVPASIFYPPSSP